VRGSSSLGVAMVTALVAGVSCETVDPGPDFQLPTIQFNANYFYCVIEPELIMGGLTGTPCGDNGSHGCHYSDKVPEMALEPLPMPVTCAAGVPTNPTQVAQDTAAANNLAQVSLEMSAVYTTAPIYLWPTQSIPGHPVKVYSASDPAIVAILKTWATQ
jgi:hypothetical protein